MPRRCSGSPASVRRRRTAVRGFASALLLATVLASIQDAFAAEVIGTKRSKVYHTRPDDCGSAKKINDENIIRFASAEEAEKAGRRLCKRCATLDDREPRDTEEEDRHDKKIGSEKSPSHDPTAPIRPQAASAALPQLVRVTDVLPGGTITLDVNDKARLLGVVCPAEGQPNARDALRFITEQTRGRRVRLTRDPAPYPAGHRDALGRMLIYATPEPDGRDLGAELLFQGYAWLDRGAAFGRRLEYARREEEAWRASRGVWKQSKTAAGKRKVVAGRRAHHYHDPKCPHAAHLSDIITITVNEAKARRLPPCPHFRLKGEPPEGDKPNRKGKGSKKEKQDRKPKRSGS